jgi:hypothetical protein
VDVEEYGLALKLHVTACTAMEIDEVTAVPRHRFRGCEHSRPLSKLGAGQTRHFCITLLDRYLLSEIKQVFLGAATLTAHQAQATAALLKTGIEEIGALSSSWFYETGQRNSHHL